MAMTQVGPNPQGHSLGWVGSPQGKHKKYMSSCTESARLELQVLLEVAKVMPFKESLAYVAKSQGKPLLAGFLTSILNGPRNRSDPHDVLAAVTPSI